MRTPRTLTIDTTTKGTVRIAGDLDLTAADRLRPVLAEAVAERSQGLVIDVSALNYCGTSGLAVLVQARNDLSPFSQLILHGASGQLRRLLQTTQLQNFFTLS